VLVVVLVLDLLRAVGDEVSWFAALKACDIKEEKENILMDGLVLAFPFEPPTRARLLESVGPSSLAVMPLSTSADLSFENRSFTVRVSYFSDSTIASNFPPQIVRSKECKSLAALS
jgi:hypothetical protein